MTVVEALADDDGVMVDDSIMTVGEDVGVAVGGVEVGSSEVVAVEVSLIVTPVDKLTLWRLKSAIASSRGSADAAEAHSRPVRRTVSLCMMKIGFERRSKVMS